MAKPAQQDHEPAGDHQTEDGGGPDEAGSRDRDRNHLGKDFAEDIGADPDLRHGADDPGEDPADNPDRDHPDQETDQEQRAPHDGHHGPIEEGDYHRPQTVGELAGPGVPAGHRVFVAAQRAPRRLDGETEQQQQPEPEERDQ